MTNEEFEDPKIKSPADRIGVVIFGGIQIIILIALGLIVLRSCQWGP